MSTGTKVFLTIFAVLVGLLVLYYGILMPAGSSSDLPVDTTGADTATVAAAVPGAGAPTLRDVGPRPTQLVDPTGHATAPRGNEPASVSTPTAQILGTDALAGPPVSPTPLPATGQPTTTPPNANVDPRGLATGPPAADGTARANVGASLRDPIAGTSLPPAVAPARATFPPPRDPLQYTDYIVQPGDTLSDIALEWFGDESDWHLIAQANPTVDPIRMRIGERLRLPPRTGSPSSPATGARAEGGREVIYVVQAGDTLSGIARMYYGDTGKWRVIYDANRRALGAQPDRLDIGMRLIIPPPFPRATASR